MANKKRTKKKNTIAKRNNNRKKITNNISDSDIDTLIDSIKKEQEESILTNTININRINTRCEKNKRFYQQEEKKELVDLSVKKEPKKIEHNFKLVLVYLFSFIIFEILYHIFTFGITNLFSIKSLYYVLFALISSLILTIITKLMRRKVGTIFTIFIILFIGIYYFASYLFKNIFNTYFSIHLLGVSDQAVAFMGTVVELVLKAFPVLLLFLLPSIFVFGYRKRLSFKIKKGIIIKDILLLVISITLFIISINVNNEVHNLFYQTDNNALNIEHLGINVSTYLDIKRIFIPVEETIDLSTSEADISTPTNDGEKVYEPNTLDIDFDSLISSENNSNVKSMHEYISKNGITYKNEYTGIFKDKNLIVIMGESLNDIAISEKYTPTLYKLAHESFEFPNFYTPVNMSTLGGEFQDLTGLFANLSMLSNYFRKGTNTYPFGLGKVFNDLNYNVNAYHANYGTFQNRNVYLKTLGFNNFLYRGNGLEKRMNCNLWPQSDLDMFNVTMDDFINSDKFMTYYVSVSGHMPWSWSGNDMSRKYKEVLKDSNYSEEAAAYIAANMDLDKAVEKIIEKLTESNKLDDTVIAIVPDHYPYSMNINTINELSSYDRDTRFEVNHSTMIIWNNTQEHVVIDKTVSQLDFLPTLYNLFGINYDSRLIMGKDALSTSEGLVYFTDRSWISDKGRYISATNKFTPNDGVSVDENYVSNMNKIVSSRINMSKLIIEQDYYKKVFK